MAEIYILQPLLVPKFWFFLKKNLWHGSTISWQTSAPNNCFLLLSLSFIQFSEHFKIQQSPPSPRFGANGTGSAEEGATHTTAKATDDHGHDARLRWKRRRRQSRHDNAQRRIELIQFCCHSVHSIRLQNELTPKTLIQSNFFFHNFIILVFPPPFLIPSNQL